MREMAAPPPPPPSAQTRCTISSVRVKAFKSFAGDVTVNLNDAITGTAAGGGSLLAVAGRNGAGKSSLLEAICFACGCSPGFLRVKTLAELHSTDSPKQLCEVEITLSRATAAAGGARGGRQSVATVLHAKLAPDNASREYRVDGRIRTAGQVREQLREAGVMVFDRSPAIIKQAHIAALASESATVGELPSMLRYYVSGDCASANGGLFVQSRGP